MADSPHPETTFQDSSELSTASRLHASKLRPSEELTEDIEVWISPAEESERPARSPRLQREVEELEGPFAIEDVDVVKPGGEEGSWNALKERERMEGRIAELESKIENMRGSYEGIVEGKIQDIRAMKERLKLTEGLLETRTAELTGAHAFLSTADRLSDVEVLGIVRDLNENIYQVAVNLTDEWEKLYSLQATSRMDVDPTSRPQASTFVQRVVNRRVSVLRQWT